jgi:hypothetical protein
MEAQPHNPALGPQSGTGAAAPVNPPVYPGPSHAGAHVPSQQAEGHEDAPPSYEDAIASDLPPLAGPRPAYSAPAAPEGESRITGDEKRR